MEVPQPQKGHRRGMGVGIWFLKRCQLLERLTEAELVELESRSLMRRFARGTPIYLPSEASDAVFLLAKGRVKICYLTPDGRQSILGFVEPGEVFGESALVDPESEREEYAEAVEASEIVWLPGDIIRRIAEQNPALSLGITRLIGLRRKRVERRLRQLLFLPIKKRLCHLILELAEEYGKVTPDGIALGIRLSHQDLAAVIGATRETVTVLLGELQSEGLIAVGRRKITVLEMDRLAKLVEVPPPAPKSSASHTAAET